jgi:hypothetical protein
MAAGVPDGVESADTIWLGVMLGVDVDDRTWPCPFELLPGLISFPLALRLRRILCANSLVNDLILTFFSSDREGCRCAAYDWPRFSFSTRMLVHCLSAK